MKYSRRRGRRPPTRQEVKDAINLIPRMLSDKPWPESVEKTRIKQEETILPNQKTPVLVSRKADFIKWDEVGQITQSCIYSTTAYTHLVHAVGLC